MNMFTTDSKPRQRGRPPGQTLKGAEAKDRLYATAIGLFGERGYDETTLRDIAGRGRCQRRPGLPLLPEQAGDRPGAV